VSRGNNVVRKGSVRGISGDIIKGGRRLRMLVRTCGMDSETFQRGQPFSIHTALMRGALAAMQPHRGG